MQRRLEAARGDLAAARSHLDRDPALRLASRLPFVGSQASGLRQLVGAAEASAEAGLDASAVLLAFARQDDDPQRTAVQEGVAFLDSQQAAMAAVRLGLEEMKRRRAALPSGLVGPLAAAAADLDDAIERLDGLVGGYERAQRLLPTMLGFHGPRRYLVLPQNETEIFASGGLISNYGIATFADGRVTAIEFEYFINLFDRWQERSGGEYVEPPAPLRHYLLKDVSWGLGEAGWFPDFPTTAALASRFVEKGGVEAAEGTIALDLHFVAELLRLLGPLPVDEYGVTVTADNLSDLTLELTRGESSYPGSPGKGFLSALARELLSRVFAAPKEEWVDLIRLLDRMGRERHLQLHFLDRELQALSVEYGLDGGLAQTAGDFLFIADTSVNSTKLNLILEPEAVLRIGLAPEGAVTHLTYAVHNPFPEWQQGRDPLLVSALMHEGVYGSYLRLYVPTQASLIDLRLNGAAVGAEEIGSELGRRVFGRFFPVLPGAADRLDVIYESAGVVKAVGEGRYAYSLYIQKQPGTVALPLTIRLEAPPGTTIETVRLDGDAVDATPVLRTDLRVDRLIEVVYRTHD